MPFIPHTPESLLHRSDSKNPATTCKGITSSGRPCRRALATSPRRFPSHSTTTGVLAVMPSDDDHEGAAAFFCFQHKEQAVTLQNGDGSGGAEETRLHTLNERTSIDTLVDRLGFVDIQDNGSQKKRRHGSGKEQQASRPVRKSTLPKKWQDVQGPLLALPQEGEKPVRRDPQTRKRKPPSFFSMLCCWSFPHEEPYAPLAPKPRPPTEKPTSNSSASAKIPRHPRQSPSPRAPLAKPNRPSLQRDPPSQTQDLLRLIPKSLSPQTTSALLSELAKPVSEHDEEGYIYIFWLTPTDTPSPDTTAVSSLLGNSPSPAGRGRRASNIPASISAGGSGKAAETKKMLLKIGRASNVQRRMNEWTRQCGYALTLIRYYPYIPTSTSPAPSPLPSPSHRPPHSSPPNSPPPRSPPQHAVHKVPHAHKIERLIHLELGDKRVKKGCKACGREHREWFEVEGSREGVRSVDEVVRRWVGWGEGRG